MTPTLRRPRSTSLTYVVWRPAPAARRSCVGPAPVGGSERQRRAPGAARSEPPTGAGPTPEHFFQAPVSHTTYVSDVEHGRRNISGSSTSTASRGRSRSIWRQHSWRMSSAAATAGTERRARSQGRRSGPSWSSPLPGVNRSASRRPRQTRSPHATHRACFSGGVRASDVPGAVTHEGTRHDDRNSSHRLPADAKSWDQALYAFLVEKGNRSGSRRTVEGYGRVWPFFADLGKTPDRVTPPTSSAGRTASASPAGPRPLRRSVPAWPASAPSTASSSAWAWLTGNPCDALQRPRTSPAPARGLTPTMCAGLAVVPDTVRGRRDRAILLSFVLTGRRRTEINNLKAEDMIVDDGTVSSRTGARATRLVDESLPTGCCEGVAHRRRGACFHPGPPSRAPLDGR